MATIQITKNKACDTLNTTVISQVQSLDVVQTMLHGGLSCITFLRSLFADKVYDDQAFDSHGAMQPYAEYASGHPIKHRRLSGGRLVKLKVLRRGRSRRVDRFLDWMEHGAFPALQAGKLRAMEIYVHPNDNSRDKVLETYTFTIKYHSATDNRPVPIGDDLDSSPATSVKVGATNEALGKLLFDIITVSEGLPHLPPERRISMALFYIDDEVDSDAPRGFVPNESDMATFANADEWTLQGRKFDELHSGFHQTAVLISHLAPIRPSPLLTYLPTDLRYDRKACLHDRQQGQYDQTSAEKTDDQAETAAQTPSTIVHDDEETAVGAEDLPSRLTIMNAPCATNVGQEINSNDVRPDTDSAKRMPTLLHAIYPTLSQTNDFANTQSSNIPEMRNAFGKMMQTELFTQGDTQPCTSPPPVLPMDGNTSHRRSGNSNKAPSLSQSVKDRLELVRGPARVVEAFDNLREVIMCQCGHQKEEGDMVKCSHCATWQHLHCHGYTGEDDERVPEDHLCYQCLLAPDDEKTLTTLKDLINRRRAAHIAVEFGLRTHNDLATKMRIPTSTARELHKHLKDEGYVVPVVGGKARKYSSTGKPYLVAPDAGPGRDKMLSDLFDPLLRISHYYDLPEPPATLLLSQNQRSKATTAGSMLPPETPASQLRRDRAVQTPAESALDLRDSVTPYKTPIRLPSDRMVSNKRPLDDEDDEDDEEIVGETPVPSRTRPRQPKRIRSVRTEATLDAAGQSSSPAPFYLP